MSTEKQTLVISGFPGVGKTHFSQNAAVEVLDSDSSKYSWLSPGVRHPNFPQNYIEHIKSKIGEVDIILVSSHGVVREALNGAGIDFTLVYPATSLKAEYMERYAKRGNDETFIAMMGMNWDYFIAEMEEAPAQASMQLAAGEYLSTIY